MEREVLVLTKLDVAKRELNTAIGMFFDSKDPVAIHVLASSAQALVGDVSRARGMEGNWLDEAVSMIGSNKKAFIKLAKQPQNFFKHADKDPDELLLFNPEVTEFVILDGVETYISLLINDGTEQSNIPSSFLAFRTYGYLKHLDGKVETENMGFSRMVKKMLNLDINNKTDFQLLTKFFEDWRVNSFKDYGEVKLENWRSVYL